MVGATQPPARFEHPFGNVGVYLLGRLGAFLIDVVAVTYLFATFGLQMATGGNLTFAGHDIASYTLLLLASLGAAALLLLISEGLFGTSLGKLVFALHVRRTNGNWAGPGRAILRMIVRPIDLIFIGPFLALITPRHQRLGDLFAGTVVARSRIGWLSTLLGLAILALVGYTQIIYGGGVTTALAVAVESATYLPQMYRSATQPFEAVPTSSPLAVPTLVPAGASPAPEATDSPAAQPTDAPASAAPENGLPTQAPPEPTDAPPDGTPAPAAPGAISS
jgi:uncharacterized RDD family membrane protein YckC